MKPTEFYRWYVEVRPGKVAATRYVMTEADALQRDPTARRVPGSLELRNLPETDEEWRGLDSGRWAQKNPGPG